MKLEVDEGQGLTSAVALEPVETADLWGTVGPARGALKWFPAAQEISESDWDGEDGDQDDDDDDLLDDDDDDDLDDDDDDDDDLDDDDDDDAHM